MAPNPLSVTSFVIAESNSSILHAIREGIHEVFTTGLAMKLFESLIVFIVALIFLRLIKSLLKSLERKNVVSALLSGQIYRLLAIVVYSTVLIVIAYIITSVGKLIDFAFIIGIAVLLSNWKLIADVTAYYLLLAFRGTYQSSLIELPRLGVRGRIVGSTLFHTRLRTPEGRIVYIPNHIMISEPVTQLAAVQSIVRLEVDMDTPKQAKTSIIEAIETLIKQALRESKSTTRLQDVVIQVRSLSPTRARVLVNVPVAGSEPRPATINNIMASLYKKLEDLNPQINVICPSPQSGAASS